MDRLTASEAGEPSFNASPQTAGFSSAANARQSTARKAFSHEGKHPATKRRRTCPRRPGGSSTIRGIPISPSLTRLNDVVVFPRAGWSSQDYAAPLQSKSINGSQLPYPSVSAPSLSRLAGRIGCMRGGPSACSAQPLPSEAAAARRFR